MLKKQNGITLIALVITIIVMLILAGVVISMVVGDNGIITKSKQAKKATLIAEITDHLSGALTTADMEEQSTTNSDILANFKFVSSVDTKKSAALTSVTAADVATTDGQKTITLVREFANVAKILETNGSATFFGAVTKSGEGDELVITNAADAYYMTGVTDTTNLVKVVTGADGYTYTFNINDKTIKVTGGDLASVNLVSLTYKWNAEGTYAFTSNTPEEAAQ